jgi:tRNA threonylcarbamoyladenosine biosynthesis protein TsaE
MKRAIQTEKAMQEFGNQLSVLLDGGAVLELIGDVGAGKTTLTRAIARGLGITDSIQSPTFTISNRYEAPNGLVLAHYDFYRLNDAGIMKDELVEALGDKGVIAIIEWGDIIEDVLPNDRLTIYIQSNGEYSRQIEIVAHGERMKMLIGGFRDTTA